MKFNVFIFCFCISRHAWLIQSKTSYFHCFFFAKNAKLLYLVQFDGVFWQHAVHRSALPEGVGRAGHSAVLHLVTGCDQEAPGLLLLLELDGVSKPASKKKKVLQFPAFQSSKLIFCESIFRFHTLCWNVICPYNGKLSNLLKLPEIVPKWLFSLHVDKNVW